jgi:hypothetical protein
LQHASTSVLLSNEQLVIFLLTCFASFSSFLSSSILKKRTLVASTMMKSRLPRIEDSQSKYSTTGELLSLEGLMVLELPILSQYKTTLRRSAKRSRF